MSGHLALMQRREKGDTQIKFRMKGCGYLGGKRDPIRCGPLLVVAVRGIILL